MKKKIAVLSMVLLTVLMIMSGCGKKKSTEYFNYRVYQVSGEKCIQIMELTDFGKEQEYIIIPGAIGGIKVKKLGGIAYHGAWKSKKLKKVYVQCYEEPFANEYFFKDCKGLEKVILFFNPTAGTYIGSGYSAYTINSTEEVKNSNRANLSFRYNYSGAPNEGFYWIDDLDDETIKVIPADPTRKGYRFDGWYKEPECNNKWDFETDIVSGCFNEEGKYEYKETCLYAKWDVE